MKNYMMTYVVCVFCTFFLSISVHAQNQEVKLYGPLRVSKENPRYFTNDEGKAVYPQVLFKQENRFIFRTASRI